MPGRVQVADRDDVGGDNDNDTSLVAVRSVR